MPRKIRQLAKDLIDAGFHLIPGGGKGSHRKYVHQRFCGVVTLSGNDGDDAKIYQEKQVRKAFEEIKR
jgi:predicted RNA binding protein YcfA (HicA-like mRNA interferase family)